MTINQKIDGLVSFVSNSPGIPTGYGQQALYLTNQMLKAGMKVASLSNYGHEGGIGVLKLEQGEIPHYPRGFTPYSTENIAYNHEHFRQNYRELPHAVFILYDVWPYNNVPELDNLPIVAWVPIDHITLPPGVASFLKKPNVTTITMSPDGQKQLEQAGIPSTYIPHVIDRNVYKPTYGIRGKSARELLGISESDFLVGMVAANKANGIIHRKAFAENLLAFSLFSKEHPDAKLYLHTEATRVFGGFNLGALLRSCGIDPDKVIFPDPFDLRFGLEQTEMAALYTTFDVLLATSYGEGFGVPTMEAQACGTRVIASSWAASQDLVSENSWLVEGMPFWDEPQTSWFKIPIVDSIVAALKEAYKAERGVDQKSIEFASQFDNDKVWGDKWAVFWKDYFAKQSDSSSSK